LRGQHTYAIAWCFPFNRRHDYVSEHQNSGILAFIKRWDKESLFFDNYRKNHKKHQ